MGLSAHRYRLKSARCTSYVRLHGASANGALMDYLKVSSKSSPASVAGAIAGLVKDGMPVEIQSVGAGAVNQAIKAIAIARGFLIPSGIDVACTPSFQDIRDRRREPHGDPPLGVSPCGEHPRHGRVLCLARFARVFPHGALSVAERKGACPMSSPLIPCGRVRACRRRQRASAAAGHHLPRPCVRLPDELPRRRAHPRNARGRRLPSRRRGRGCRLRRLRHLLRARGRRHASLRAGLLDAQHPPAPRGVAPRRGGGRVHRAARRRAALRDARQRRRRVRHPHALPRPVPARGGPERRQAPRRCRRDRRRGPHVDRPSVKARRGFPCLGSRHLWLQQLLHLLHRSLRARQGAQPHLRERPRRGRGAGGGGRPGDHPARAKRELLRARPVRGAALRRAAACRGGHGHPAPAVRHEPSQGPERRDDRAPWPRPPR